MHVELLQQVESGDVDLMRSRIELRGILKDHPLEGKRVKEIKRTEEKEKEAAKQSKRKKKL